MRRRQFLTAAVLAAAAGFVGVPARAGRGQLLADIKARGTIKVGMTGDYYPYSYRDIRTGGFLGYEVDVANRLAADLGVRLELVQTTWPALVAGLRAGKYDIAASGITITPERARAVAFSRAYLKPAFVPLVPRDAADTYASWRDLDRPGVTIALQQGTAAETSARRLFKQARLVAVMEPVIDFTEVLAGRANATVTDNLYFASKIGQEYPQLAMVGGEPLAETENGLMVPQGEPTLLAWLDEWVAARQAEGFFDELQGRWFGTAAPR